MILEGLADIGPINTGGFGTQVTEGMWIFGPEGQEEIDLGRHRGYKKIKQTLVRKTHIGYASFSEDQVDHFLWAQSQLVKTKVIASLQDAFSDKPKYLARVIGWLKLTYPETFRDVK